MFSLVKQNKTKPKGQLSVDDALSVNTVNVKTNEQEKRRRRRRRKKSTKKKKKKAVSQSYSIREQNSLHNNLLEIQGCLVVDRRQPGHRATLEQVKQTVCLSYNRTLSLSQVLEKLHRRE